jgi:hippurate hydrolase
MNDLDVLQREMTHWRRELHRHPEFGFEEKRTAAFVADEALRDVVLDQGASSTVPIAP